MTTTIRFFKEDNKWYADILGHSLDENEMVMGSDMFLDAISLGTNQVFIKVSDEEPKHHIAHFHMKSHDDEGAYYTITGELYNKYAEVLINLYPDFNQEIWICNVTHDIFGEHPEDIYIIGYQV